MDRVRSSDLASRLVGGHVPRYLWLLVLGGTFLLDIHVA
jgi:hypothetical protein